jgi:protein-S-isoprenylcysteine O-methyltransferase Ste14
VSGADLHRALVQAELGLAALTFAALRLTTAPYGRHRRAGWGPTLPARIAWTVMESPACLFFLAVYAAGPARAGAAPLALLGLWQLHYAYRAFLYPRGLARAAPVPVPVVALGFSFNLLNAWVNARWISALGSYPPAWLADPRFLAGAAAFAVGLSVARRSDRALLALRRPGEEGYRIPRGGLFERVSCPNYLGELVQWGGWALATWSLAGLAFAVYTAANLVPRALDHHAWYRARFPDYPPERRALVPWLL